MINTFYLVIFIALVLALFRVTKILGVRNLVIQKIGPLLNVLELLLWTVIVFWSAGAFLSNKSYYNALIIILAVLFTLMLSWFYLKDIVAGFLFRVRHNPLKGQILTCDVVHGSVHVLGLSQLTVETDEGQWIRIPYSALVTRSLSLQSPRHVVIGETTLELNVKKGVNPVKAERVLKRILSQSAWCIASKPIKVQMNADNDKIRISFYLLDPVYSNLVKSSLIHAAEKLTVEHSS